MNNELVSQRGCYGMVAMVGSGKSSREHCGCCFVFLFCFLKHNLFSGVMVMGCYNKQRW